MHAIAVMVPVTERLVIDRLRATVLKVSNDHLKHEISQVIKQEGIHARHHRAINNLLIQHGFTAIPMFERIQSRFFRLLERWMPTSFVESIPAAMEHFTANISKSVITEPELWFDDNDKVDAARFLEWHAYEEIEHQAVCFDLYKDLEHNPILFSLSLILFWMPISAFSVYSLHTYFLIKSNKLQTLSAWKNHLGFMKKTCPIFMSGAWKYCKRDYSPWDTKSQTLHQNKELS
jgi:predicted metal-dependent hydrolase